MGRYKRNAIVSDDYRKVAKSVSLPSYLVKDLEAQGKLSVVLTEILQTHKEAIGDGVYMSAIQRRKELLAQEIESVLREKLPLLIGEAIETAVTSYLEK